jgi:hypothetical protein
MVLYEYVCVLFAIWFFYLDRSSDIVYVPYSSERDWRNGECN